MDDVTAQNTVETQVEETTTPVGTEENKQPEAANAPQGETLTDPEKENLKKALKQERERYKTLLREQADFKGRKAFENLPGDNLEEVMGHPMVQELQLKVAEYELKEGVKEIFDDYPNLPKALSNAILKNPRGYVNPATTDVQNALLDIRDYIEGIYSEFQPTPQVQPKTVPIAGTNKVVGATGQNADIQAILSIPPEEWTPEQEKAVETYKRVNK